MPPGFDGQTSLFLLLFCSSLLPLPVTFGMFFFPAFGIVLCVLFGTVRLLFAVLTLAYILPVWLCNIKRKNECAPKKKRKKRKTNSQRQNGLGTVVVVGTKSKKETLCSFVLAEQKLNFFYLSAGVHTYTYALRQTMM